MDTYPRQYLYRRVVRAKLFIDAQFSSAIDLDNIADEACFSKFHFVRLFKSIYGRTPHQYLTDVRVSNAQRELLADGRDRRTRLLLGRLRQHQFVHRAFSNAAQALTPAAFQQARTCKRGRADQTPAQIRSQLFRRKTRLEQNSNFREVQTIDAEHAYAANNGLTMITKLNHVQIFVLDQDSAYDFYVNKLGFTVHTDASMGPGKRWLTVMPARAARSRDHADGDRRRNDVQEGIRRADARACRRKARSVSAFSNATTSMQHTKSLRQKASNSQNRRPRSFTATKLFSRTIPAIGFHWDRKEQ